MLVFLYGSDAYRLKQLRDDLINRYKNKYKSWVNLFFFDLSETLAVDKLEEIIKSSSLFDEYKFIICKNVFDKKVIADQAYRLIKEHKISEPKDTVLAIVEESLEKELLLKHRELFKILSDKNNTVRPIKPLEGAKLAEWVKKEFQTRGSTIQDQAVMKLVDIVGNDTWVLANEIEKLGNYKGKKEISTSDIDLLVSSKVGTNIFDLIDAVGLRNPKKAVELLYKELESGRDPYYVFTMIVHQFRNLITIKDLYDRGFSQVEIAKKSGLHPFVVKKAIKNINQFKTTELTRIYGNLLAIDVSFKNGVVDIKDSMHRIVTLSQ